MSDSDSDQELFPIKLQRVERYFSYYDFHSWSGVLKASSENNLDLLKQLVSRGKSVNINDNLGNTALHIAALQNLPDIADFLLSLEQTMINNQNFQGITALWYAAKVGHISITKKLIEAHADVNIPNLELVTPLHAAVQHPEVVKLLIENGADIEVLDYNRETPLHDAISLGAFETACMLLYFGADANIPAYNGLTPFMRAIIKENLAMQDLLLEYVTDFNGITTEEMTVLKLALCHNCPYVEEIIRRGIDVHHQPNFYSVFLTCLRVPDVEKFKIVWKYYRYQNRDKFNLFSLMLTNLDNYYTYCYLKIIIESGNVDVLFQKFRLETFLEFARNTLPFYVNMLPLVEKIVCLYLTYGYEITGKAIGLIYRIFKQGHLLDICLHMDIDMKQHDDNFGVVRALYDTSISIEQLKVKFLKNLYYNNYDYLSEFLPYFRINNSPILQTQTRHQQKQIHFLHLIPSLLELARNKTREHLIEKFALNSSKKYYLYLRHLDIPKDYKDIITFRRRIYTP